MDESSRRMGKKGMAQYMSGKKVEVKKWLMRAEGDKRELKVIENRKEEGETRENRKEKELMRDKGTSNK